MNKLILSFGGGNDPEVGGDGGGGGKALIISMIILNFLFIGCSIKKEKSVGSTSSVLNIEEMTDSDGDGVPDSFELKRGSNPFVADIPRIQIAYVQSASMGGSFKSTELENSLISKEIILPQNNLEAEDNKSQNRDYFKTLRKKALINQVAQIKNIQAEKIDTITNEDLRTSILSDWQNENYYKALDSVLNFKNPLDTESGKILLNFKIKLTDTHSVSEVSNIKLKTFFYNFRKMEENNIFNHFLLKEDGAKEKINIYNEKEANPVTVYSIISTDISILTIADNIKNRSELGLKFTDYDYISSGIALNYNTILQKVLDRDAKIIFSTNDKTEVYFISPQFTLEEALKIINKKVVKNSDGGIYSINNLETNASLPINLETVSKKDFKNGIWSIVGDADSLEDKITEKGIYLISYASVGDLVDAARVEQVYPESKDTISDSISIDKIIEGDEINININELYLDTIIEEITSETKKLKNENECIVSEKKLPREPNCGKYLSLPINKNSCEITHSKPKREILEQSYNYKDLWNNFEIRNEFNEEVKYSAFYAGSNIKIVFDKELPFQRNNLKLFLKAPTPRKVRVGVISSDCPGIQINYTTQTIEPSYIFKRDITIYSQTKY